MEVGVCVLSYVYIWGCDEAHGQTSRPYAHQLYNMVAV